MKNPYIWREKPDVIILYAQWDFGKGGGYQRVPNGYEDNQEDREKWFKQCLGKLRKLKHYQNFVFLIRWDVD